MNSMNILAKIRKNLWWAMPVVIILLFKFSTSIVFLEFYVHYIYQPLQNFRNFVFGKFNISIGDILYVFFVLYLLYLIFKSVRLSFNLSNHKKAFLKSLKNIIAFSLFLYASFLVLWGGNYSKNYLEKINVIPIESLEKNQLIQLNRFLIDKLNSLEQKERTSLSLSQINQIAEYEIDELLHLPIHNLQVKKSSFGNLLNYLGVYGYYNPFSGESHFNKGIPDFLHPFVVAHEMAHQVGIAKEDDANVVAYLIGRNSGDLNFKYSSYFNIFMYAFRDIKNRDNVVAEELMLHLNPQSQMDMEELKNMHLAYKGIFRKLSNIFYDRFLIIQGQEKGLKSYNQIVKWVYYLEISNK